MTDHPRRRRTSQHRLVPVDPVGEAVPTVVVVGRPNVGKSTLFNRLTGARRSITHDQPGVTRDRVVGDAQRPRGGSVVLVDTGGFEAESEAVIPAQIRRQALAAVQSAHVAILLVDGAAGLTAGDEELATELRRADKPVILAVNKSDRRDATLGFGEFSRLGFPLVLLSAEHGRGIEDLWDQLEPFLPPPVESEAAPQRELGIAIVGRPNVGKSSLLNALLGEERVIVSAVPGTTRDAVDTVVRWGERTVRLVDTAGIRRKGRTDQGPEVLAVVMARRAVERAHVCMLLLDSLEGVTAQDAHVAGIINDAGRAVAVVVNKVDLLTDADPGRRRFLEEQVLERLKFLKGTPMLFVSARTGAGLDQVMPTAMTLGDGFLLRIGTGELNRVLHAAWDRQPPPGGRRPPRFYYAAQLSGGPPRIMMFWSGGELHFSYMRYLENAVRDAFPLAGVPIRFIMRGKRERSA
ncbi:MAG TPA: ribosome biogenesis GTPase Der [Thermoanaerobaculaceae bacterium]|nr:ribosome biogenesis GTPase Der [Thermoanaerobaculaceae bacterium]HPS78382.1 ribosome biogenesis GTPase Der [Thermoanaerobaculaceae bacterium]